MTSTATTLPPAAPAARDARRAWRDLREPVLGGVAAGLAAHLAVPVIWVRVAFVVATFASGLGVFAYAALWVMLPAGPPPRRSRPVWRARPATAADPAVRARLSDIGPVVTLAALGVGVVFATGALLGTGWWVWPLAIAVAGVALLWRQADEAQRERWLDATGKVDPARVVIGGGGWAACGRIAAGVALVAVAVLSAGAARRLPDRRAGRARWRSCWASAASPSSSPRSSTGSSPTSAQSGRSGCAPRSAPTSPPTCTTPSCRPSP